MDLNAFNKLYSEATDAIAERRLLDAIDLVEAIMKDTVLKRKTADYIKSLRQLYTSHLDNFLRKKYSPADTTADIPFQQVIILLMHACHYWQSEHPLTIFGHLLSSMEEPEASEISSQLTRVNRSQLGRPAYHEALDAAFNSAWVTLMSEEDIAPISRRLRRADAFTRQTMAGALMMGVLDCFQPEKLRLLLLLAHDAQQELEDAGHGEDEAAIRQRKRDAQALLARVAVALTLISMRHRHFLPYFPELSLAMRDVLLAEPLRSEMPQLLYTFVCQSLTDRVGQRVDDIITTIKDVVEQQQPHLGSNSATDTADDESNDRTQEGSGHPAFKITHISIEADTKLFNRMLNFAETMEAMRSDGMDINFSSQKNMKSFTFFHHPAHWFYPFSLHVPEVSKGLHLPNGKLDTLSLSIMNHNSFCSSDRYSYVCMLTYLRDNGRLSITDQIQKQIEEMLDDDEESPLCDTDSEAFVLNGFTDYCQSLYRFFRHDAIEDEYYTLFASSSDILLPLLPLFDGVFNQFSDVEQTARMLVQMGDGQRAVILLDDFIEHYGSTADILKLHGQAQMQQHEWSAAASDFQQSLLFEEDAETQLALARCYEATGNWSRALPLLQAEDQRQGGKDAGLIEEIARGLVQEQRWDEAMQRFFQLELMEAHSNVCRRGIGWCSLQQGKFERAEQYYQLLISGAKKPSWGDFLNLGHALWLQGKPTEACEAYCQFATLFNSTPKARRQNFRHWNEAFLSDRKLLASHFSRQEIALMQDAIACKRKNK